MKQRRFRAVTALLSVLALSAVAAPAHAGDRGEDRGDGPRHSSHEGRGHHSHGEGHGWGHSRGLGMTVTEEVTAILDAASVEVEGSGGARVGRDDDDLIVISVGGRHRGHWNDADDESDDRRGKGGSKGGDGSNAVVTFTGSTVTSEWTDVDVDYREGVVTAEVDGVEDVPVLTVVRTDDDDDDSDDDDRDWRRRGGSHDSSTEYQLTEESAVVLGAVVGTDAFEAGDVFATAGGCGR